MPANMGIVDDGDYEDPAVETLHHAARASDAALEAAEELVWPLGGFVGLCVYLTWDTWLGAAAVAIAAYFFARYKYKKAHDIAWATYEKASRRAARSAAASSPQPPLAP